MPYNFLSSLADYTLSTDTRADKLQLKVRGLTHVYIDESIRGLGLGKHNMQKVKDLVKEENIDSIQSPLCLIDFILEMGRVKSVRDSPMKV